MTTRERIIEESLTLFATNGYKSTSVERIAQAVGIKAPSLYKHFKGKKEILEAVMEEMNVRYDGQVAAMQMNGREANQDDAMLAQASEEQLIQIGVGLFQYFLHDSYMVRFRKMLTMEQYQDEGLARLFSKQYVDDPIQYQTMIFERMMQNNHFQRLDARMAAIHFYAPILFLIQLCDREPEREKEEQELIVGHIKQFGKIYRNEEYKEEML